MIKGRERGGRASEAAAWDDASANAEEIRCAGRGGGSGLGLAGDSAEDELIVLPDHKKSQAQEQAKPNHAATHPYTHTM